jgi:hypothetical protein
MSRKKTSNRDTRGDDVETSLRVTAEAGGFRLEPRIANYEQFDVAVRVSFPLPDSVDHAQISAQSPSADAWRLDAATLRLTECIDWADTVTRTCSVEGVDRSHLQDLVDGATVEISDMDGTELAVETDMDVSLPSRGDREKISTDLDGAETDRADGSKPDTAKGRETRTGRDSSAPSMEPAAADTSGPSADPASEGTSEPEPRGGDSRSDSLAVGFEDGSEAVEADERADETGRGPELHRSDPDSPPDEGGTDRSTPEEADAGEAVAGLPVPMEGNRGASQFEWFELDPATESTDAASAGGGGILDRLRGYLPE